MGRVLHTSVSVLGIRIDNVTLESTLEELTAMVESRMAHHVVTINPEYVMKAQTDRDFRNVLGEASLCLPDGIGILWGARILGTRLRERVTGVDTVRNLARIARDRGYSMFFLGAADGVAQTAASLLKIEYPGLRIAGTYGGSPHANDEDHICEMIESTSPDILLVAYGAPSQDLWIRRTLPRLRVPVSIGVGGSFDFIAGVAKRAPIWMRSMGLEWMHRLYREPHRWRRMLALPYFAALVCRERLRKSRSLSSEGDLLNVDRSQASRSDAS